MIQTSLSTALSGGLAAATTGLSVPMQSTTAIPSVPMQSTTEQVTAVATQLLGLAVFAGLLAAVVALLYRWASREQVPVALALLVGLSGVALYLNTTSVLGRVVAGETALTTDVGRALFNIGAFLAGGVGSVVGQRAGDRFGTDVILDTETSDIDEEVNRLVRTVGRVIVVTLPDDIDDVVGYDPVAEETKEKLAGKRFLFPRSLTVGQLRERLVSRLKTDYGVGTVDLELADDGTVEYLGIGSRAAGIGPTLPPATNAVAIRADPAFAASAGDIVQVWETDPMRRVLTAELRGVADDVVTLAIDAADTPKIDPRQQHRLVTLPVEDRPEREFASLLRAAEETFSTITVEAGSPLHGMPVGALDLLVIAVRPDEDGSTPIPLPADDQLLAPGDTVFAIGRPEGLRRLEIAGAPLDPSLVEDVGSPSIGGAFGPATPQTPEQDSAQEPEPVTESPTDEPAAADDAAAVGEPLLDEGPETPTAESPGMGDGTPADGPTAGADAGADTTGDSGGSTFDELKDEFESGEADWDEGDSDGDDGETETTSDDPGDDLVGLEDADISFDEDANDDEGSNPFEADNDLETFDLGEEGDDEFDLEDGGDGAFDLDDGGGDEDVLDLGLDDEDDEGGLSLDDDEDDDDDDDGGGGSTFAQLKEEFESGDADWEDDISDSPGGDMRLDE